MLLTFDDGPSEWTPAILDLFDAHDAVGVFFVIGQNVAGREDVVERMADAGHVIGNHGWTHHRLDVLDELEVARELAWTSFAVEEIVGVPPVTWRAPYFRHSELVDERARMLELGSHFDADIVTDDWNTKDAGRIVEIVVENHRPSRGVVCLHDGMPPGGASSIVTDDRLATVEAVRILLEAFA